MVHLRSFFQRLLSWLFEVALQIVLGTVVFRYFALPLIGWSFFLSLPDDGGEFDKWLTSIKLPIAWHFLFPTFFLSPLLNFFLFTEQPVRHANRLLLGFLSIMGCFLILGLVLSIPTYIYGAREDVTSELLYEFAVPIFVVALLQSPVFWVSGLFSRRLGLSLVDWLWPK